MDNKKIANQINYDIEKGIFDDYQWLKNRIQQIAYKLFVINSTVTHSDLEILKENNYIH